MNEYHTTTYNEAVEWLESFPCTLELIKGDLLELTYAWLGHHSLVWRSLTPEHLHDLNQECLSIRDQVKCLFDDISAALGVCGSDIFGMTLYDYEAELFNECEFEFELMQVIQKSYEFSSGHSQGINGVISNDYDDRYTGWRLRLLRPITVAPWAPIPPPKLVAPERPRVILKVMSVLDCSPRISVGLDDDFFTERIGVEILVDEDVKVDDRVIIKTSGWGGPGHELIKPEYDGLAEPGCPCSTFMEVMEAKYDFDLTAEQAEADAKYHDEWIKEHFKSESKSVIRSLGKSVWLSLQKDR